MHERHAGELYGSTFEVGFFFYELLLCTLYGAVSNAVRSNEDCMNAKTIEKASERKRERDQEI